MSSCAGVVKPWNCTGESLVMLLVMRYVYVLCPIRLVKTWAPWVNPGLNEQIPQKTGLMRDPQAANAGGEVLNLPIFFGGINRCVDQVSFEEPEYTAQADGSLGGTGRLTRWLLGRNYPRRVTTTKTWMISDQV